MFWMCIRIAPVRRFLYTSTTYDFMMKYRNFSLIILIPTPDFPQFYYLLGGNLGSLLYGVVSVMLVVNCLNSKLLSDSNKSLSLSWSVRAVLGGDPRRRCLPTKFNNEVQS